MKFIEEQAKKLKKHLYNYEIYFLNLNNLKKSIIHPTYSYEKKINENNQRMEFLGDSIIGFIVSEYLYNLYPYKKEGDLSKIKGKLVSKKSLSKAAKKLKLYYFICVGKGENILKGEYKESILSDTFESLTAAIYLDMGYLAVKNFINKIILFELENILKEGIDEYKTVLQEITQNKYKKNVEYKIIEEFGFSHEKNFLIGIFWKNNLISIGFGQNKKYAENNGAQFAINYFNKKK